MQEKIENGKMSEEETRDMVGNPFPGNKRTEPSYFTAKKQ